MERLGKFADARTKVLADVKRLVATVQQVATTPIGSVEAGIAILKQLRAGTYEDLNQIQHEFMIVRAAEWLVGQKRWSGETVWFWNPRQTGPADEPDLRGEINGTVLLSAEITTSTNPQGEIDTRMRDTLEKLSRMAGARFYFTASSAMHQRASTKIAKSGWQIEAVHLSNVASVL
ncbi:MAG: hypothetical protein AB1452_04965 [Pseudomonadota bacterium]